MRELVRSLLIVSLLAYVTSVAAADSGTLLVLNKSDNTAHGNRRSRQEST